MALDFNINDKNMRSGIKVTLVGSVANILLSALKLTFGIIGQSRALVADAIHSLSDLATDIVVLFGLRYGSLPADKNHHYGHKKIETVTELALGVMLIAVAIDLAYGAIVEIRHQSYGHPKAITIVAAVISILSKEWLFRWNKAVAIRVDSRAIMANAWHHRSDAYSSVAVFIGLVAVQISSKLAFMDAAASLVVSVLIIKVGWTILLGGYNRIIDTAPPASYIEQIDAIIAEFPGVLDYHKLRMRYIGSAIHMEVHIKVDPNISVKEGHKIAAGLKHKILEYDSRVLDVTVHVEPLGESSAYH